MWSVAVTIPFPRKAKLKEIYINFLKKERTVAPHLRHDLVDGILWRC